MEQKMSNAKRFSLRKVVKFKLGRTIFNSKRELTHTLKSGEGLSDLYRDMVRDVCLMQAISNGFPPFVWPLVLRQH